MAVKNYHSYRGKTPRWKVLLGVVLVLVIVASLAVIRLQAYIVYDETGTPHLWLPEKEQSEAVVQERPAAGLVVEETPPEEVVTVELLSPEPVLTEEAAQTLLAAAGDGEGIILPLKSGEGRIFFRAENAVSGAVQATDETTQAIAAVVTMAPSSAARMSCFLDPRAALMNARGMALLNRSGYIFYDGSNHCWLDPGKEAARDHLCALAAEAAQFGFDTLILANVGYPTEGALDKINYGEQGPEEYLELFLRQLTESLPSSVELTIEMSAQGILDGGEGGLSLALAAKYAHRIAAVVTEEAEIEALAAAVAAADKDAAFVPILSVRPAEYGGSYIMGEGELR